MTTEHLHSEEYRRCVAVYSDRPVSMHLMCLVALVDFHTCFQHTSVIESTVKARNAHRTTETNPKPNFNPCYRKSLVLP